MKVYCYAVTRDFGFAPNPFHGWCTLATCKPRIRARASKGDWVIGIAGRGYSRKRVAGHLIFAMQVEEALTFDEYWRDARFGSKRPMLNGSLKQLYGDNIYHRGGRPRRWLQANSHHSREKGRPNRHNIRRDTQADRVLLGRRFVYFGEEAPRIPKRVRTAVPQGDDLSRPGRGHRVFEERTARALERYLVRLDKWGLQGFPLEFGGHVRRGGPPGPVREAGDR